MSKPDVPENKNDSINQLHPGIIHFAYGANRKQEVDNKAVQLSNVGFRILREPRKNGDDYMNLKRRTLIITDWK